MHRIEQPPTSRPGVKHAGGRPPKFSEPRRAVTVTLPERTLARLADVDTDRARAIVKVTDAALGKELPPGRLVEVLETEPGMGVILVGPSKYLRRIPWLKLVEVAPLRYLLVLPTGTPIDTLEVALRDVLDDLPASEERERDILEQLELRMRHLRRGKKVTKAEMLFVNTSVQAEAVSVARAPAHPPGRRQVESPITK